MANVNIPNKIEGSLHYAEEINQVSEFLNEPSKTLGAFNPVSGVAMVTTGHYSDYTLQSNQVWVRAVNPVPKNGIRQAVAVTTDGSYTITFGSGFNTLSGLTGAVNGEQLDAGTYLFIFENTVKGINVFVSGNIPSKSANDARYVLVTSFTEVNIKNLYEANNNTNAFTNALLDKLNNIEDFAEANQTDNEILIQLLNNANVNVLTDAEKSNLQTTRAITNGIQVESSTLDFSTHVIKTLELSANLDVTEITGIGTVNGGGVAWLAVTHNGFDLTFNTSLVDATNVKTFKDTNGVYYITIQNRGTSLSPDYVIYDPLGDGLIPLNLILTSSDLINASEINYTTGGQVWAAPASGKIRHFIGGSFKVNITTPFDSGTLCIGYDINNKLFEYPLADLSTGFWPVLGDVFDGELKWWIEGTPPTTGDGSLVLYAKYSTDFDEI
jgi:hypothetical protein